MKTSHEKREVHQNKLTNFRELITVKDKHSFTMTARFENWL